MQYENNNHISSHFSLRKDHLIKSNKEYNKSMLGVIILSLSLFLRKENLGDIHKRHPRAS